MGEGAKVDGGYFRSIGTVVYRFSVRKKYTTSYETLDTLIESLTAFTARQFYLDRQAEKSKDQALNQHPYLGGKNNLGGHCYPNYFPRIGPNYILSFEGTSDKHL